MPSFQDSAVIFFLALLLFGPKKLPELARQLGKLMGEFRRASSEFRLQMEDELRVSEQEERQKQIAAIEAAAPKPAPALADANAPSAASDPISAQPSSTVDPDGQSFTDNSDVGSSSGDPLDAPEPVLSPSKDPESRTRVSTPGENTIAPLAALDSNSSTPDIPLDPHPHGHLSAPAPVPIATSGDLSLMPPATGLPVARNGNGSRGTADTASSSDLAPAFAAIPHTATPAEPPPPPDRYYRPAGDTPDPEEALASPEPAAAQHG